MGEANLYFASVQFKFLPDELERAEAAFEAARSTATADQRWVAGLGQYEPVLDALETSHTAYKIGNSATALGVFLAVFERHVGGLAEGWCDAASGEPTRAGTAPLESVFGVREIPVEIAAAIRAVIDRMVQEARYRRTSSGELSEFWPATQGRSRRGLGVLLQGRSLAGTIPAGARSRPPSAAPRLRPKDHSHRPGEQTLTTTNTLRRTGLSPQARGAVVQFGFPAPQFRTIPAGVRSSTSPGCSARASWGYPRERGEQSS